MKKINSIEDLVSILKVVKKVYKLDNAVIAGGAVRDFLYNKEIKDIDIFTSDVPGKLSTFDKIRYGIKEVGGRSKLEKYSDGFLVLDIMYKEHKVQVIKTRRKDLKKYVTYNFDIGLCQISLNDGGVLYTSPWFNDDVKNKTLTINMQAGGSLARVHDHLDRLAKKYPQHKIVIKNVTKYRAKKMLEAVAPL